MKIQYREIKGGSILKQVRAYNNRDDVFLTGKFVLISPRPFGEGCGDFLNICNAANRVPENRLEPWRPEEILTYNPAVESNYNRLNAHDVRISDIQLLKNSRVSIEYTVDAGISGYEPHQLILPFLYIPMLRFVIVARVGAHTQKLDLSFSRYGALMYEIATYLTEETINPPN